MTVAVPEPVAPAKQVLTEFRLAAKHRGEAAEFRRTAKRRPLKSFSWDRKVEK